MALPDPSRPDGDGSVLALNRGRLTDVLRDTLAVLETLRLPLTTEGVDDARRSRDRLTDQLRDRVLPRLGDVDAPAVVVVGGSTGAGKSTLVNSVLGQEVSQAGILRPTTRTPVLVTSAEDAGALTDHPVAQVCRVVTSEVVPAGLALVDASDLDSVHAGNRRLAVRLLEAADLWIFVTTAARYGDHAPWASLEAAARRGTPVAVVLNRVPDASLRVVRRDLLERLDGLGLADAPFFVVPDVGPSEGLLAQEHVADLRDWLRALAGSHRAAGLLSRTGRGVWTAVREDLETLADAVNAQADAADALRADLDALPAEVLTELREELDSGRLAEGAPSTRWVSLASAGGPLASLAQGERLRRGILGRAERARADALASLAQEARSSLVVRLETLLASLVTDAETLRLAATSPGERTGQASPADVEDARGRAHRAVDGWAQAVASLPGLTGTAAPAGLTTAAARDLLLAAAAGVDGARAAARRLDLGESLDTARALLATAVEQALNAAVGDDLPTAPDPSLAAALRLRAGELTPLTRPGAAS